MENILVIDDDEKILELVQEVLKNEHYIVETRSYVDNTNIGEFEGFDLILLDIMLPFLDGYEILERIKNIITCPVIFLSANYRNYYFGCNNAIFSLFIICMESIYIYAITRSSYYINAILLKNRATGI